MARSMTGYEAYQAEEKAQWAPFLRAAITQVPQPQHVVYWSAEMP